MDSFFYLDANNQQKGPVPADKLLSVGVDANTLVWKQGMASWMKAGQVAELGAFFMPQSSNVPPRPAQPQPVQPQPAQPVQPVQTQPVQPQPAQPVKPVQAQPVQSQAYKPAEPQQPQYQQPAQPQYQQPAQQQYQQPAQPQYQQPAQPQYQQPAQQQYQQPAQQQYQQPAYQQPAYQPQQDYQQSGYQQQPYDQQPGYQQPYDQSMQSGAGAPPSNYLVWSILVTIFCCWPFGIPAIVNAAKVNRLYQEGNYDAACTASANAKKWTIVSAIVGGVIITVYLILWIVALSS